MVCMGTSFFALFISVVAAVSPIVPIEGEITRRFSAPACPYCAGHRGVTISSPTAVPVVAVAAGEITFAGEVGGLTYVVQRIAPQVRVTYGWLADIGPNIVTGLVVEQGAPLGTSATAVYLGVRVGEHYVEPLRYLGLGRVRLHGPGAVSVGDGRTPR